MQRHLVVFGQCINHVGSRNRFGDAILPAAALNQIIKQYRDYVIGLDKCAILVHNSESISVSVCGNADASASLVHLLPHFVQEMIFRLGRMAAKKYVADVMDGGNRNTR